MKKLTLLLSLAVMLIASSCKSSSPAATSDPNVTRSVAVSMPLRDSKPRGPQTLNSKPVNALPKATAFRMSGDYADHVAISVDNQGNLTYFPAPTDITAASAPVSLTDGWWLNRQGIGINSVFTKYTFSEYAALPSVPSIEELKASIIPGARVTEVISLPYTISEAPSHIQEINDFLLKAAK
ncbi:MAG: hypothetical protein K2L34_15570 [Muribaculaceae bacterium]|nr:hypothetical protein [Muribaculaceae bacterium]